MNQASQVSIEHAESLRVNSALFDNLQPGESEISKQSKINNKKSN